MVGGCDEHDGVWPSTYAMFAEKDKGVIAVLE